MTTGPEKAKADIETLDRSVKQMEPCHEGGSIIVFDYDIRCGPLMIRTVALGIQIPLNYPDVPPHFVYIQAGIQIPENWRTGGVQPNCELGNGFNKISLPPPQGFWDNISPDQKMKIYLHDHIRKIFMACGTV